MQLRTNIFIWVFLATVLPLTVLALSLTQYSQREYQREVYREVTSMLANLGAEIDRQLQSEREAVQGLLNVPAMQGVLPVLHAAREGRVAADTASRLEQLGSFFEDFQAIFPGLSTLRVLDYQGNAILKVSDGRRSETVYESLGGLPYAEQEIADPGFVAMMERLPLGEVAHVLLPHRQLNADRVPNLMLYDYLIPLEYRGERVGALAVAIPGAQLDRIVRHAARPYRGELFIVEINPDQAARDGLLLYDDARGLRFFQVRPRPLYLEDMYTPYLWSALGPGPDGVVQLESAGESVFYAEMLPYPNLLVGWTLGMRVDGQTIAAPFQSMRWGIWLFAGVALLASLLLANLAARTVARPVCRLARSLKAFADGDWRVRARPQGLDEISVLAESFNYMADTLERARAERDRAQQMLLQHAKLASIGQMAAGIGHEINNPLNNILSLSKLLQRSLPPAQERLHRDLDSLRDEALRASDIVRGVLNFARQLPPRYTGFEIEPWLNETATLVQTQADARGVILRCECRAAGQIDGDRAQLQQALVNLLVNAIHASDRGQTVILGATLHGGELVVSVRDWGHGIGDDADGRIFDPFYSTKPVGQGSGLGLSISLGIVEYHQGQLSVANHPEGGVIATIRLPLARAAAAPAIEAEDVHDG